MFWRIYRMQDVHFASERCIVYVASGWGYGIISNTVPGCFKQRITQYFNDLYLKHHKIQNVEISAHLFEEKARRSSVSSQGSSVTQPQEGLNWRSTFTCDRGELERKHALLLGVTWCSSRPFLSACISMCALSIVETLNKPNQTIDKQIKIEKKNSKFVRPTGRQAERQIFIHNV